MGPGRLRTVQAARITKIKERGLRATKLRRAGAAVARLVNANLKPAATFGGEVVGCARTTIAAVRGIVMLPS